MKDNPEELPPELSKLNDTYDVLAELHRIGDTPTYLARHRELGRDVTITLVHVAGGGENNALTHFASDARLLATLRHPNIVPVLEGRWLDADTFAVVRARVRGSTLEQVLSAVGQMPIPRIAETLRSVNAALEWARDNGVVHRGVSAESLVFQQPTGRALLALEPAQLEADALPDACDDTRTLGTLAWEMLTGTRYDAANPPTESLISLRPELPPMVAAETEHMLHCQTGEDATEIPAYLAALTGAAQTPIPRNPVEPRPQPAPAAERVVETPVAQEPPLPPPQPVAATPVEPLENETVSANDKVPAQETDAPTAPAAPAAAGVAGGTAGTVAAATPEPATPGPATRGPAAPEPDTPGPLTAEPATPAIASPPAGDDVVVVQQHGMGFNARMITAVAVAAVLLIVAAFVVHNRRGDRPRVEANTPLTDTSNAAAGDVALTNPDSMMTMPPTVVGMQPGVAMAPPPAMMPAPMTGSAPITGGTAVTPGTVAPIQPAAPAYGGGAAPTYEPAPAATQPARPATSTPVETLPPAVEPGSPTPNPNTSTPPSQPARPADTTAKPTTILIPKVELPPITLIHPVPKKDSAGKRDSTATPDTAAHQRTLNQRSSSTSARLT